MKSNLKLIALPQPYWIAQENTFYDDSKATILKRYSQRNLPIYFTMPKFKCRGDACELKGTVQSQSGVIQCQEYQQLPVFFLIYQCNQFHSQSIINQMAQNQSNPDSSSNYSPSLKSNPIPSSNSPRSLSQQKNGKWSQIQHCKYIVFMQSHRDQFKSKQQRRTHKFYKNMAQFIKTRNALQCRSHHQKLEERYCYANKIILAFKQRGDMSLYEEVVVQLREYNKKKHAVGGQQDRKEKQHRSPSTVTTQTQSQTDIFGINAQYVFANPTSTSVPSIEPSFLSNPYIPNPNLSAPYLLPYDNIFYQFYQYPQKPTFFF